MDLTNDQHANAILATTVWPAKFAGWSSLLNADGSINYPAVRALENEPEQEGPWDGCSSGEWRQLQLACIVAEGGALSEALNGIDEAPMRAFLDYITSFTRIADQGLASIERFRVARQQGAGE